jgi:hypothetical protein
MDAQGYLRVKVAKSANGELVPLEEGELASLTAYMQRVKDAGVYVEVDSLVADRLQLHLDVYYDPLILTDDGKRIDGTDDTPVAKAIDEYLKNLPFDGVLVAAHLTDALQRVEGVLIPTLRDGVMWCGYGSMEMSAYPVMYRTDAGYIRLDALDVQYKIVGS